MCRFILVLLLLLTPTLQAAPQGSLDRIQLTASASRRVVPDRLQVRLYAQAEGPELAVLADRVNRSVRQAVAQAKETPGVAVESGGYATWPVYRNRQQTGWRVRQTILLRGRDLTAITGLLGRLQGTLALEEIDWAVSPKQRERVLAGLRRQAVERFRAKARSLAQAFGYCGYRLVQADIDDGNHLPGPVAFRTGALPAKVTPPALPPGGKTLSVTIRGTVRLTKCATSPAVQGGEG